MKFRLTEKIGSGGMAEVFRAVGEGPEGFERPFVIKRIHPHLSEAPEFVRMFVDEAKISARLIHPNIVQVFEFAHQDGSYYIVMEPVEGMDMGWLRRRRSEHRHEVLPTTFVAEIGRQACRGLDFAHTLADADGKPLGIVHRDVTPPNIMVAWNGAVKILDFGIARAAQALRSNLTDAGMVKGKMSYLAPELLDGKTADARCDVFSLGVVLHELLTGKQLFAGENDLETLKLVKEMPIPRPSELNPGVKPGLDNIVMRALERDPELRYRTAGQMGDELEALVMRKGYSTRTLAQKARELFAQEEGITTPGPSPAAPITMGQEDSSMVVDQAVDRSKPVRSEAPAAGRSAQRPRWLWLAVGVPALSAAALLGAILRPASIVSPPVAAAPPTAPVAVALPRTVRVAVDSNPQGATVTSAAIRGGERLGETPILLDLPRGETGVELQLAKSGFVPLPFKVIPQQDKDVLATLERVPVPVVTTTRSGRPLAARHTVTPSQQRTPVGFAAAASAARSPGGAMPAGAQRPLAAAPIAQPRR
jgi:serine/threonine protein kinase